MVQRWGIMRKGNNENPKEAVDPPAGEDPAPMMKNTRIETYVVDKEGQLKLAAFYIRVDRKEGEKSPFRRMIEESRLTEESG